MPDNRILPDRKTDHIHINHEKDVQSGIDPGFSKYQFQHNALPEMNLSDIDTGCSLFGKSLAAPILISSMTGGAHLAGEINTRLAAAAQHFQLAFGVGSQRACIEEPAVSDTFQVRNVAPDILLFANLGAVQLNYGYTAEDCQKAVDGIQADALFLHLNPLQEGLQPEGETNFAGLLKKIEAVCRQITVPVVVKEVGWGISGETAKRLFEAGVSAIDVAGAGGTSWSQVEMYRIQDPIMKQVAADFKTWGISTADSLLQIRKLDRDHPLFASGGLRNGLDLAKALALGADLGGFAGPFLRTSMQGQDATDHFMMYLLQGLRLTMFAAGCNSIAALKETPLITRENTGKKP